MESRDITSHFQVKLAIPGQINLNTVNTTHPGFRKFYWVLVSLVASSRSGGAHFGGISSCVAESVESACEVRQKSNSTRAQVPGVDAFASATRSNRQNASRHTHSTSRRPQAFLRTRYCIPNQTPTNTGVKKKESFCFSPSDHDVVVE